MRTCLLLLLVCSSLCGVNLYAQNLTELSPSIKVVARVDSNQIKLRWAVTTPSAWVKANKYGYIIERFTIKREGQQLDVPEKVILTPSPLLPKPLPEWEAIVEKNDYAAVFAQALYGQTFETEEIQGGVARIINTSKEIDQRFSFALFAADLNFEAAMLGGLAFIDTEIKENEDYFYTVKTAIPTELLVVKAGNVFVETNKKESLPQPIDLIAIGDDKNILLTWEYEMFKKIFTSYYLERSENGTDFKRMGNTPLVNLNDKPGSPSKRMFFVDTISQNDKMYYYRVKGISPFGELSPPSEIASAKGIKKLGAVPHITRHQFDDFGNVDILWEFPKEVEQEITGFELDWAPQEKGPYTVATTNISKSSRKITFKELAPSNYFKIRAIGKGNQETTSLTAFVQAIDSIPPEMPVGLIGSIDTLGVVKLKWTANTEKDLLGYRIFRGNLENDEVSQLTVAPIEKTVFTDTVQLNSLNTKVFYQIVAVDQRFNMSNYSVKLTLKKPDVVPPSSPIFSKYKVEDDGVRLHWINSSSGDVVSHQLFRQNIKEAEKGWMVVFQTDTVTSYLDREILSGIKYRYAIFAEDQSGLQSLPSTPLSVTSQNKTNLTNIKAFIVVADRVNKKINLNWKIGSSEISEIIIYKSKKGELPVLWKQIPGAIYKLTDTAISPNNVYVYQLKVITKMGEHSEVAIKEVIY